MHTISRLCPKGPSDIKHGIPISSLFPFPLLSQNLFHSQFSIHSFAVCVIVQWLLHFVVFSFFKAIIVTLMKPLGHLPVLYVLFISCIIILRPSSPNSVSTPHVHHHLL